MAIHIDGDDAPAISEKYLDEPITAAQAKAMRIDPSCFAEEVDVDGRAALSLQESDEAQHQHQEEE